MRISYSRSALAAVLGRRLNASLSAVSCAGTPVQNNIGELYSVLSVLDPAKHPPTDDGLEDFMEEYGGNTPTAEQVRPRK